MISPWNTYTSTQYTHHYQHTNVEKSHYPIHCCRCMYCTYQVCQVYCKDSYSVEGCNCERVGGVSLWWWYANISVYAPEWLEFNQSSTSFSSYFKSMCVHVQVFACTQTHMRAHMHTYTCTYYTVQFLSLTMQKLTGKKSSPANALEALYKHFSDMDAGTDDNTLLLVDEIGARYCVSMCVCACVCVCV